MTRRILCIEDDPDIAELTNEVLAEAGFRVDLAITGMQGLARLGEAHDAILCDIDLPGLSGLELLRALRKTGSRTPFVLLTAFAGRENQIEARQLGCDDFVAKPIDFELLLAVLHNVLQRTAPAVGDTERPTLTEREREVLARVVEGKSSVAIAALLGISERTVNFHVDRVMRKLNVATRTQAAITCVRLGLMSA